MGVKPMTHTAARLLFWSPRILAMAFAISMGLFALEAFNDFHGFWRITLAFLIDLVPAYIVIAVLALAWKWEWTGAAVFALLAAWYSWGALDRHILSWSIALTIPLPMLVIAGLFLANWIERGKLRTAN